MKNILKTGSALLALFAATASAADRNGGYTPFPGNSSSKEQQDQHPLYLAYLSSANKLLSMMNRFGGVPRDVLKHHEVCKQQWEMHLEMEERRALQAQAEEQPATQPMAKSYHQESSPAQFWGSFSPLEPKIVKNEHVTKLTDTAIEKQTSDVPVLKAEYSSWDELKLKLERKDLEEKAKEEQKKQEREKRKEDYRAVYSAYQASSKKILSIISGGTGSVPEYLITTNEELKRQYNSLEEQLGYNAVSSAYSASSKTISTMKDWYGGIPKHVLANHEECKRQYEQMELEKKQLKDFYEKEAEMSKDIKKESSVKLTEKVTETIVPAPKAELSEYEKFKLNLGRKNFGKKAEQERILNNSSELSSVGKVMHLEERREKLRHLDDLKSLMKSLTKPIVNINPVPLKNIGNTCFLNSILQCFVVLRANLFTVRIDDSTPITEAMAIFIFNSLGKAFGNEKLVDPSKLISGFDTSMNRYFNKQQQDAAEALLGLYNMLIADQKDEKYQKSLRSRFEWKEARSTIRSNSPVPSVSSLEAHMVHSIEILPPSYTLYEWEEERTLIYEDLAEAINSGDNESILKLRLELEQHELEKVVDLASLIRAYYGEEDLGNGVKTKLKRVGPLPEVYTIALKRFKRNPRTGKFEKNKDPVRIPKHLDVTSEAFMDAESEFHPAQKAQYRLQAVILHTGELESGHYISLVNHSNWWLCDDANIQQKKYDITEKQSHEDCIWKRTGSTVIPCGCEKCQRRMFGIPENPFNFLNGKYEVVTNGKSVVYTPYIIFYQKVPPIPQY